MAQGHTQGAVSLACPENSRRRRSSMICDVVRRVGTSKHLGEKIFCTASITLTRLLFGRAHAAFAQFSGVSVAGF